MREWAERLVARARVEGLDLTGEDGLLSGLVRQVLQAGLEVDLADHLGFEAYDPAGRGFRQQPQRVVSQDGDHRDRRSGSAGPTGPQQTFEPVNGAQARTAPRWPDRQRDLLYAKGLTTGDIQSHLLEIYDTEISRETISKITDAVLADMRCGPNTPGWPGWHPIGIQF